jgi:hypothetical protein
MAEFHVDDSREFATMLKHLPFKDMLSIRKPPLSKPLIIFGHDECIFKQVLMTSTSSKKVIMARQLLSLKMIVLV